MKKMAPTDQDIYKVYSGGGRKRTAEEMAMLAKRKDLAQRGDADSMRRSMARRLADQKKIGKPQAPMPDDPFVKMEEQKRLARRRGGANQTVLTQTETLG